MKALRIVSFIVMVLLTLFFVVYAQIQTNLAMENQIKAQVIEKDVVAQTKLAEQAAADARNLQAQAEKYRFELEECQSQ